MKHKPIEAIRWMKHGDHDSVRKETDMFMRSNHPYRGIITVMGEDVFVTKGDYILRDARGFYFPIKPDKFKATYME